MIQIDMPMPDNCVECRFNVSEFWYCNAMPVNFCGHVNDFEEDGRPEWCPLKAQEPYKKGYWIYPLSTDCSCSECGNQPEHEPGESIPLYDYCPYCGAEMKVKWE